MNVAGEAWRYESRRLYLAPITCYLPAALRGWDEPMAGAGV